MDAPGDAGRPAVAELTALELVGLLGGFAWGAWGGYLFARWLIGKGRFG